MFENFKSGYIEKKFIKLCRCTNKLREGKYNKDIKEFIPNISEYVELNHHHPFDSDEDRIGYTFTIGNITYGFESYDFVYIKVGDIVIFHNRTDIHCKGILEGVFRGWNHKLPLEMMRQIKKDSQIINEYVKNIKRYIKQDNETTIKHKEEQERLNKIFCENNKERKKDYEKYL